MEPLSRPKDDGFAKISQLEVINKAILIDRDKNVIKFYVAMHHVILMTILESRCHLFEQFLKLFLRQLVVKRVDVFAQVHVLCIRNDIEVLLINIHVNELDYVRMVQLLEHLELPNNLLIV